MTTKSKIGLSSLYDKERCLYFGRYLCGIAVFYPTSLQNFGYDQTAAAVLLLVMKICEFKLSWNSFLVEMTGFSKESLNPCAVKLCQKYLDITISKIRVKVQRLKLLAFKY